MPGLIRLTGLVAAAILWNNTVCAQNMLAWTISTYAGNGNAGASGNGGAATAAELNWPEGLAFDGAGNLYVTEINNNDVRVISACSNIINAFAGQGPDGFAGDGGPALSAQFCTPFRAVPGPGGDFYVADWCNNRVRRIAAGTGVITTVAGNGSFGFSGDGGPATAAEFNNVVAVAFDAQQNLYISDQWNERVRVVDHATGVISTFAGSGATGLSGDGGPATAAAVWEPCDLIFDPAGDLFIADYANGAIRQVAAGTGIITTVAGTGTSGYSGDGGPATAAQISGPNGFVFDSSGNLLFGDSYNARIRQISFTDGIITTVAGAGVYGYSGDGGPSSAADFGYIQDLAEDADGNVYVSDLDNNRVRVISSGIPPCTTLSPSPSATTPPSPTASPSATVTPSFSQSPSRTPTFTLSVSPTQTPCFTVSPTLSPTPPPFLLTPRWPNPDPAGPSGVWLPYDITDAAWVDVKVYDVAGELVRSWTEDPDLESAGWHERPWDERNSAGHAVASGLFLARIHARSAATGEQASAWEKFAVVR